MKSTFAGKMRFPDPADVSGSPGGSWGGNHNTAVATGHRQGEEPSRSGKDHRPEGAQVVAFGGAKGGVGRTVLAANVAVYLAALGKRVVLLDADFSCPNAHTILGMPFPVNSLDEMVMRKRENLNDLVGETPIANLGLISCTGDPASISDSFPAQRNPFSFHRLLSRMDADFVVLDLASGNSLMGMDLFLMADYPVMVTVPEPISLENTYRSIKSAFYRRLWHNESLKSMRGLLLEAQQSSNWLGILPPPRFITLAAKKFPDMMSLLLEEVNDFRPKLIVNFVRSRGDDFMGEAITTAIRQKMCIPAELLGFVEYDYAVSMSVRRRTPFVLEFPEVKPSRNIESIARRIVAETAGLAPLKGRNMEARLTGKSTHYDVLEIEPGASDDDIRQAHKRLMRVFDAESIAAYGLFTGEDMQDLSQQVQEAYETLADPIKRREYDLAVLVAPANRRGGSGSGIGVTTSEPSVALGSKRTVILPEPSTPEPGGRLALPNVSSKSTGYPEGMEIDSSTRFTGNTLQRIREHRAITLEEISQRTKVSVMTLRAIEEGRFGDLPASVYVRGFVEEVAKYLDLPPKRVSGDYLQDYQNYFESDSDGDDLF